MHTDRDILRRVGPNFVYDSDGCVYPTYAQNIPCSHLTYTFQLTVPKRPNNTKVYLGCFPTPTKGTFT